MKRIYAIRDVVAGALIGTLMVFRHDAAAIREFSEACANPESLGRRAQDYVLLVLAQIDDSGAVSHWTPPEDSSTAFMPQVVLTGAAWLAAQKPSGEQLSLIKEA